MSKKTTKVERIRQLDTTETRQIAEEAGYEIVTGTRPDKFKAELISYIESLPEDSDLLTDKVVRWYNIAGRLVSGEANTLKEAVKLENGKAKKSKTVPKKKKEVRFPEYVGANPIGPDKREKQFPVGKKAKYIGTKQSGKEFFGNKSAEIVGYLKWPQTGILLKAKDGKKKAVTPNAIELV